MSDEKPSWSSVLELVPEARAIVGVRNTEVGSYVADLTRTDESPAQMLTVVELLATPSVRSQIESAFAQDLERRRGAASATTRIPRSYMPVKSWHVLVSIALAIVAPVPALPLLRGGPGYILELEPAAILAGVAGAIAVGWNAWLERGAERHLPFPRWLQLLYAAWTAVALGTSWVRVSSEGEELTALTATGIALLVVAVIGYVVVYFRSGVGAASRPRGYSADAASGVSPDSSAYFSRLDDLDDELRSHVNAIFDAASDADRDAVRGAVVHGIQRLYGRDVVDEDEAEWMLREALR